MIEIIYIVIRGTGQQIGRSIQGNIPNSSTTIEGKRGYTTTITFCGVGGFGLILTVTCCGVCCVFFSSIVLRQVRRQVQEFDLVITSGGIGPTHDDITIYSVARALNQKVRENKVG